MNVANFLDGSANGAVSDYEVTYCELCLPDCAVTATHTVRRVKNMVNALASFNRAVPGHGKILKVRRVK